jgi:hypothetical protein
MESLLKQVPLTQDVSKVLDEIRAGADNALYGAGSVESEELFAKHVVSLIEGAGLPVLQTMHYRWFLRELARLWRTRTGRDLAFHLEFCIRKWVGLGLEPKTLQFLVCEAHERLKGKDLTTKTQRHEAGDMAVSPIPESGQSVESVKSVDDTPAPASASSADNPERISHPPITPITEDSSSVRNPNPNLPESVESVDVRSEHSIPRSLDPSIPSASTTKTPSHQEAEGGDMTGLSHNTDRVPSPEPNDERTVRQGPQGSRTIIDGTLPGIMAGPRPPARGPEDLTTKTQRHKGPGPDSSADVGSEHSIPRSLDPSIPEVLS